MFSTHQKAPVERHWSALLCALTLGFAGSAVAQTAPGKASDQDLTAAFNAADKDHDKSLSPFEARHMPVAAEFAKYDTNKDGFLSLPEYLVASKSVSPAAKTPAKK